MYNILYIVSNLRNSGTTSQLFNLVTNIDRSLFEISILTLSDEDYNSRLDDFIPYTKAIISLGVTRRQAIFEKRKFQKIIEDICPDIIHTHTFRPDLFAALYIKDKSFVCSTVHSHSNEFFKSTYGRFFGGLATKIHIFALRKIKYRIACSNSISIYLKNIYNIESKVIYNGVMLSKNFNLNRISKSELRKKHGLDINKKILVYVGSLSKLKNVIFLINSFKECDVSDKCQLLLLGEGEMRTLSEQLADDSVIIKGNVDNVEEFLLISDIIVSASESEGLPMAIIEGMNAGLPVLISNIKPHYEILKSNKEAGELFINNNYNDFREKLINIINSDCEEMGMKAKKIVLSKFTAKMMANNYEKEYLKIINGSRLR